MPWLQLTLESTRDEAAHLSDALEEAGALSVSLEGADNELLVETDWEANIPVWKRVRVVALFAEDTDAESVVKQVTALLSLPQSPAYTSARLADQDWVRAWMDRWQPQHFGANLWVVPSWMTPPEAGAANIILDPGMAFGTGTHATTAMCLEWLAQHPPRRLTVLDVGCGSGILAIAALKLGADRALATDTDPQALAVSRENAVRNRVAERLTLYRPEELPEPTHVDLVLANILAAPLVQLAPQLTDRLLPGGQLVLSGLLASQAAEVEAAYAAHFVFARRVQDDWAMLSGRKRN